MNDGLLAQVCCRKYQLGEPRDKGRSHRFATAAVVLFTACTTIKALGKLTFDLWQHVVYDRGGMRQGEVLVMIYGNQSICLCNDAVHHARAAQMCC